MEIHLTSFSEAVNDINLQKKTAFTNPILFAFKIRNLPDSTYCENFGRFRQRKFNKITNKVIKTVKTHRFGHL